MRKKRVIGLLLAAALAAAGVCGGALWRNHKAQAAEDAAADAVQALRPAADTPEAPMQFASLQTENPHIIAWLTVEGTVIDYPVVQCEDNDYYLEHDVRRQKNKNGALFLDYRVSGDVSDFYNVIYGHHMRSGRMFQALERFKEKDIFDARRTGWLYTPAGTYKLEFFAVALTDHSSDYYAYLFLSPAEKQAHLEMIRRTAMHYRDIGVTEQDRILALSTCSFEYRNARTVVLARLAAQ